MRHAAVPRHAGLGIALALTASLAAAPLAAPAPAAAQTGLTITTPVPAVSVQPGASVDFELTVSATEAVRVDLAIDGLPEGWTASLTGGGNEVQGVYVASGAPAAVTLTVNVADDAAGAETPIAVVGTGGGDTARLELNLTVAEAAGGTVSLESDYPSLRGSAEEQFQFNLTLSNETPQQLTFTLAAQGPEGWDVTIQPSGEAQAASVTVDARGTQRLEVSATAPPATTAGAYPIVVEVAAGEHRAGAELAVDVTGSVDMQFTTPDERLDTSANAGSTRDFTVVVANLGTTPLNGVSLSGTGPSEWEIAFEPATIEQIAPGESVQATAQITPSGNAIAGDYVVNLSARTEDADESLEIRVAVETPPIWGLVGLALIAATLAGMVWIFRRYGRR